VARAVAGAFSAVMLATSAWFIARDKRKRQE
jgi:hypothetical protein